MRRRKNAAQTELSHASDENWDDWDDLQEPSETESGSNNPQDARGNETGKISSRCASSNLKTAAVPDPADPAGCAHRLLFHCHHGVHRHRHGGISEPACLAEMGDLTIITVTPKQNGKGKIKLNDSALGQIRHMEHVAAVTPKLNLEEYECTIRLYAGANDRYVAEWSTVAGIDIRELDRMGYKLISGQNARQSGDAHWGSTCPTILPTPSVPRAAIPWTAGAAGSARTAIRFRYRTPTLTQPPPPSPWKSR